jgi:hypothetical protein
MKAGRVKKWGLLLAGFGGIVFFIFVVAPFGQRFGPVKEIHTFVEKRGIDATPLFYTEAEEFDRVDRHMRDAARFAPKSKN